MAIQDWSDEVVVADLVDDPQFTDDLDALIEKLEAKPAGVVLNFSAVGFVNSSNIAKLLRLRKQVLAQSSNLVLCDVNTQVWGVFLVTGLDRLFSFTKDISTALATVQLAGNGGAKGDGDSTEA